MVAEKKLIRQAHQKIRRVQSPKRARPRTRPRPVPWGESAWLSFAARAWRRVRQRLQPAVRAGFLGSACLLMMALWGSGLREILEPPPQVLWRAYPEAIAGFKQTSRGWVALLCNGVEILYADGRDLKFEARVLEPDLQAVIAQPYPFGSAAVPVAAGQEAGRVRNYELLKAAYGGTPEAVKQNLAKVDFAGAEVEFNRRNGAREALLQVAGELQKDPESMAYLKKFGVHEVLGKKPRRNPNISTWNWRVIAGTQRLSGHSFGIAIDLNKPHCTRPSYWRWLNRRKFPEGFESVRELEAVPESLVRIFERHGFIWGGKWRHFDVMHFEYRPEFLGMQKPKTDFTMAEAKEKTKK